MHAGGDEHDGLALAEDLVALARVRGAVPEIQPPFELLVAFQVLASCRASPISRTAMNGWPSVDVPSSLHPHAIRARRGELHVFDDLVPPRELVVGADP